MCVLTNHSPTYVCADPTSQIYQYVIGPYLATHVLDINDLIQSSAGTEPHDVFFFALIVGDDSMVSPSRSPSSS